MVLIRSQQRLVSVEELAARIALRFAQAWMDRGATPLPGP